MATESAGEGDPVGPFSVASTDLLQTSLASITDAIVFNPSYNYSSINPTPTAADFYDGDNRGEPVIQSGTITFNLDLTTNTAGYDLSSIVTTSHHYLDEDINVPNGGRDGQNYAVSYATVAAPTTFIPIANVDFLRGNNGSSGFGKATITNMGASSVAAVRFVFGPQDNDGTRYAEIDITGTPSSAIVEQNGTWTSTSDGNWTDAANWLDSKPAAGTGNTASFTGSTGVTVALDASRTIGNLVFDNADYTLNGPASLSLATTTGTPTITVGDTGGARVVTIDAFLAGSSGLNKAGKGTLTLTSPIAPGPVVVQAGTLEILQTLGGSGGDYNWYGPTSTTVQSGAILSINSHSALANLTLAGGELASSGTDPFYGYGSWSLQGDACTVTGGVVSTISAQQVDFNTLTNGFVVDTGSTLEITGSLKNGTLTKNGPGLMILAAPRTGTDNTFVNEGTLQVSDSGGSLRFRPTTCRHHQLDHRRFRCLARLQRHPGPRPHRRLLGRWKYMAAHQRIQLQHPGLADIRNQLHGHQQPRCLHRKPPPAPGHSNSPVPIGLSPKGTGYSNTPSPPPPIKIGSTPTSREKPTPPSSVKAQILTATA